MVAQACILAGGVGSRLGKLTESCPKPMLDVAGCPFLEYILWNLRRHGIGRVMLSVGYFAEKIQAALGDGSRLGLALSYAVEDEPLGTGGALKSAADRLDDVFLVLNGDTIFDVNYLDLALMISGNNLAAVALRPSADASRFGRVQLEDGRIRCFCEKGAAGPGLINGGVYVMRKKTLDVLSRGCSSLEKDLFPRLIEADRLAGRVYTGFFLDIGLPETYRAAQRLLPEWKKRSSAAAAV